MQEEDRLGVEEDGVDVLVGARRALAAGGHLEGAEEAGDEDLQLFHVLLLRLHHTEHQAGGMDRGFEKGGEGEDKCFDMNKKDLLVLVLYLRSYGALNTLKLAAYTVRCSNFRKVFQPHSTRVKASKAIGVSAPIQVTKLSWTLFNYYVRGLCGHTGI